MWLLQLLGEAGERAAVLGSICFGSSYFFGPPGVLSPFADSGRAGAAESAGAQCPVRVAGPGDTWELGRLQLGAG